MEDLKHLLSPIKIKNIELANRCVMPPMGTGPGSRDGSVSEANLAYIKRQAQSGVGMETADYLTDKGSKVQKQFFQSPKPASIS